MLVESFFKASAYAVQLHHSLLKVIKNYICILLHPQGPYVDFIELDHVSQKLKKIVPNAYEKTYIRLCGIYLQVLRFRSNWDLDLLNNILVIFVLTVNHRLIHI